MDQSFSWAALVTTLPPLAVILACLAAVGYFGRRIRAGRLGGAAPGAAITVIATRSFGPQSSLHIIEAEGRRFLVSAGRHGIRPIGSLDAAPPGGPGAA